MAIKQLTVFVQNKKGTVVSVTDILSKNNINLRALSIASKSNEPSSFSSTCLYVIPYSARLPLDSLIPITSSRVS